MADPGAGGGFLAIILLWPRPWQRRIPGSIVALVLGTIAVALFNLPVETIGSKFGGIPQGLPTPQMPTFSWENIRHLIQPAFTIALLAAIESLLCAVVADGMVDDRHDSNQELVAQGLANIVSPLLVALRPPAPSPAPPPTSRAARVPRLPG
jgi:SulP family sulfate permease